MSILLEVMLMVSISDVKKVLTHFLFVFIAHLRKTQKPCSSIGQLGNPTAGNETSEPVPVYTDDFLSGKHIQKVVCGDYFTVLLSTDGKLYSFGANEYGQLGLGDNNKKSQPIVIIGDLLGKVVIDVAAGSVHTIAIVSTGQVYSWGSNHKYVF